MVKKKTKQKQKNHIPWKVSTTLHSLNKFFFETLTMLGLLK